MGRVKGCTRVLGMALDIMQVALALLVVVLVTWKMMRFARGPGISVNTRCLLDGTGKSGRLRGMEFCVYAAAVGIISLIATSILRCANRCLGCLTANACGMTNFGEIIIDILLFVWWAIAFALFSNRGIAANNKNFPQTSSRNIVIASAFGCAASFALDVLFTVCGIASR